MHLSRRLKCTIVSQRPLPSLCFLGQSEKQDGRPGLWLAETFPTSTLKRLNGIQRNLTGSKISTSSTKIVFFEPIGKTWWPPCPLIGWDILDFSSETAERNSTNLDRKQDLNVLYQVCVFRVKRKKKMAALASDWLRHFRLLLLNRWTEFNETWQEARSQRPLPSLCLSGRSVNKNVPLGGSQKDGTLYTGARLCGPLGLLFCVPFWCLVSAPEPKAQVHYCDHVRLSVCPSVVNFWHFRLLLWNQWTEFNETWQKARSQCPVPSVCFLGRSEKQDGRPGLWLAETFSTSSLKPLNGIQRNLTGSKISMSSTKFVFFGPIRKTRWLPWLLIGWDIFDCSSETVELNSTKLDRKQDLNVLYQVCVFRADQKNKMAALASDWLRHFGLLLWNRWTEFKEFWQEARCQRPLPNLYFKGQSVNKNGRPGRFLKKVAHYTQVHDMWPFGPLVFDMFWCCTVLDLVISTYFNHVNGAKCLIHINLCIVSDLFPFLFLCI